MHLTTRMALPATLLLCAGVLFGQDRYPVRQLTRHPAQEGFPAWSPDGARIVYALIGRGEDTVRTGLWSIAVDGGEPVRVLAELAEHPAWSPDGRSIAFDADSGNTTKLVSSRGGQPTTLVPPSIPIYGGGIPNWSPDGTRVAFKSAARELWTLDVRTGVAHEVFSRGETLALPGCWSRDGSTIYFTLRVPDSSAIWTVSSSGGEARRLVPPSEHVYRYVDVSPDGTLLAFSWCDGRNCDLWVMPASGGKPVRLTADPANNDTPRWSPDGTRIAFTSTRADGFDVWVMTLDLDDLRAAVRSAQEGDFRER